MKKRLLSIFIGLMLLLTGSLITGANFIDMEYENGDPDLNCFGELKWDQAQANSIAKGIFYVENIGGPISELDWEVFEWPEWGTWYFLPPGGENLKPNDGAVHVHVFVDMSDLGYGEFIGNVTVINSENISDCCIIPVYMRTPMTYPVQYHPFLQFLMNRFPLFRMILSNRLLPI